MENRETSLESVVKNGENLKTSRQIVEGDLRYIKEKAGEELSRLSGKKVLITGGAGFLGYYLVQSILSWNEDSADDKTIELTVYDNYIRGIPDWLKELSENTSLKLVRQDISNPLPSNMPDFNYIIHAASIASPTYYRQFPIETIDANVNGLRHLLDYCRVRNHQKSAVEGFLFFSSSEIYGDPTPENIPTPETYPGVVSCTGPRACYDESKRFGETLCVNYAHKYQLPVKIARPFNNYGPGLKITDRRVLPDLARNILNGENIVLFSDGYPTRTFCYAADAIIGYFKILVRGRNGEAYNIGVSEPEISMLDTAKKLRTLGQKLFGYTGEVVYSSSDDKLYLTDNPNRRCPVIKKAYEELGYSPGIDLDEGLKRMLIWYRENQKAEEA